MGVTTKLDTFMCHGPVDDRHEPATMEAEQNDTSLQIEHECPKCGVMVVG